MNPVTAADHAGQRPDFFCLGVQKAGTTWLHRNLNQCEDFFSSLIKEPHYFDNHWLWSGFSGDGGSAFWESSKRKLMRQLLESVDWSFKDLRRYIEQGSDSVSFQLAWIEALLELRKDIFSEAWYAQQFALCPAHKKTGDFTPDYYLLPEPGVIELLARFPAARFLLLLRDPVERDWSALRMSCNSDDVGALGSVYETRPFRIRAEYRDFISRWRKFVPGPRLGIFFYDDLAANPVAMLGSVTEFLGLTPPLAGWKEVDSKVHEGRSAEMPLAVRDMLVARNRDALDFLADEFGGHALDWKLRYS